MEERSALNSLMALYSTEGSLADARTDLYKSSDLLGAGQLPSVNYSQQDYEFLQAIFNGDAQETGFQLGALFANFVVNTITAFVIGRMPTVIVRDRKSGSQDDDLTSQANDFLRREESKIIAAYKGSLKLGDIYVAHGLDGHLEIIAPQQGEAGFELWNDNLNSFLHVVTKTLVDPKTRKKGDVNITVIYTNEEVIYDAKLEQGAEVSLRKFGKPKVRFPHTLGECPVLLLANNREEDSVFGWSEFAPLIPYMNLWHQIMYQGFAANKYNGNPILAITGIQNIDSWAQNNLGVKSNASDAVVERALDKFLRQFKLLTLGQDQDAKFLESKNPLGGTVELLKLTIKGMVNISKIPEFMWGFEMSGSNATVREQTIALKSYIDTKRAELGNSLRKLIGWNFILSSSQFSTDLSKAKPTKNPDPKVKLNNVDDLANLDIVLSWPPQLNSDEQQTLDVVKVLLENKAVSLMTAYEILNSYIHDAPKEIKRLEEQFANKNLAINEEKQTSTDTNSEKNRIQRKADDKGSSGDNSGSTSTGNK